jgi:arabinose-5-phosphate isomerase
MRTGADCPTVAQTATVGECYEAILAAPKRSGAAAIVDKGGVLTGIVTHGDFFRMLFHNDHRSADRPVSEVMTRSPKSIGVDDAVVEALRIMQQHAIDELPVVDVQRRLVGVIDIQDLLARGFSAFDTP